MSGAHDSTEQAPKRPRDDATAAGPSQGRAQAVLPNPSLLCRTYPQLNFASFADLRVQTVASPRQMVGFMEQGRWIGNKNLRARYPNYAPTGFAVTGKGTPKEEWYMAEPRKKLSEAAVLKLASASWAATSGFQTVVSCEPDGFLAFPYVGFSAEGMSVSGGRFFDSVWERSHEPDMWVKGIELLLSVGGSMEQAAAAGALGQLHNLPEAEWGTEQMAKFVKAVSTRSIPDLIEAGSQPGNLIPRAAASLGALLSRTLSFDAALDMAGGLAQVPVRAQFLAQIPSVALPFVPPKQTLVDANGTDVRSVSLEELGDGDPVVLSDTRPSPGNLRLFTSTSRVISATMLQVKPTKKGQQAKTLTTRTVPAVVYRRLVMLMAAEAKKGDAAAAFTEEEAGTMEEGERPAHTAVEEAGAGDI